MYEEWKLNDYLIAIAKWSQKRKIMQIKESK